MNTITFAFDNIAVDLAVALLDSALYSLMVDARLLPNYSERKMLRVWKGEEVEDAGRDTRVSKPTLPEEKAYEVYSELYNAAVGKYKQGGFWCYVPSEHQKRWEYDPWYIAKEMNDSHMFDFTVSPVHVEQAQAMLKGRA